MSRYFAPDALLPHGWARDVLIDVDERGAVRAVEAGAAPGDAEVLRGPALPGMPNVHSHAFQRAFAGRAERRGPSGDDSFWSWREAMYAFVARLTPDHVEAIAAWLYVEMLKSGYTAVGEFHYLHHDLGGARFGNVTETADRIVAAAQRSGIGLTLLPVLYASGGFGARAPGERQRRFLMDVDEYVAYWDRLAATSRDDPQLRLGIAPHSLRALAPEQLAALLAHARAHDVATPVHIHIAEQQAEVEECVATLGQRPVAWLLHNAEVTGAWCLVHATHVDDAEVAALAATRAVVGLCPTTEANLGDGIFPTERFAALGGRIGIGSDSHVTVDVAQELRWLEYGQRLATQRRAVLCDERIPSVGGWLYRATVAGGAQALGRPIGRIAAGARADVVVLDAHDPALIGACDDGLLDRFLFASDRNVVRDVMVGGQWVVRDRRHVDEPAIERKYRATLAELLA